ncbi:hypothetical protein CHS0354_020292 [Potamilus streckersoni]|uniref:L-Fucosyltransferase n=1 Tax=Potamilus streckersoni TaxID=2493646 RepID=A0AAE0S5V7_9BIVA|nr:hypothetical protein CHS0354_020292 [Potamilus streckersoni]
MTSNKFVAYPLNVTTQQPFNRTSQNVVANLLNETFLPPLVMTIQNLFTNLLGITQRPFNTISQNLFSIQLNTTTQTPIASHHYICYIPQGRLGNHIFQYASIYGIATLNNLSIMTTKSCEICHYFRVQNVTVSSDKNACSKFTVLSETMPRVFNPALLTLPKNMNIFLKGYFESWKYFQNVTDSLLEQLRFKEPIERMARRKFDILTSKYINYTGSNLTVVGIHIRMEDIFEDPQLHQRGIYPAPPGYINIAMRYYLSKYDKILFIVCSDSILQAKRIIKSLNLTGSVSYVEGKQKPIHDLAILSKCDHVIQTVGTFGWWAAYLSGGTSTYYKFPARPGSPDEKLLNSYDFFYPEWIGLGED